MARFITIQEEQAIIQQKSPFLHYLLLLIVVMDIIPLPKLPIIEIAPINVILLIAGVVFLVKIKSLPKVSPAVLKIILLLLFFDLYDYILGLALSKEDNYFPMAGIRKVFELTLFALACINLIELRRVLITLSVCLFISALFGILIYYIGEPFQGIRDWLLQSTNVKSGISGVGLWISGLSGQHFLFGYLIGTAPVVALTCAQISRYKSLWYFVLLILLYTLYLNAERAAFLAAMTGLTYLTIRWKLANTLHVLLAVSLMIGVYMIKFDSKPHQVDAGEHSVSLVERFTEDTENTIGRTHWLKTGVVSVLENPFTGTSQHEYANVFFGRHLLIINDPAREFVYAHNHYVNIGLQIGILGWLIVAIYFMFIWNTATPVFKAKKIGKFDKFIFEGVPIALLSVMICAFFHNTGIFFNEPVTECLTGLLIALHEFLYNRNNSIDM